MVKKQKVIILISIVVFLFSIFQIGHAFASTEILSLKNVEIINKSDSVDVSSITYENKTITNDITFHKVGDTVTYRITVKNNENESITIKAINDNNTNEYITYEYDSYAGTILNSNEEKTFNIIVKYSAELTDMLKREQAFSVDFLFNIEDEKGNSKSEEITMNLTTNNNTDITSNQADYTDTTTATSSNPKTGDNIGFYIALAALSFVMLIIFLGKNYSKSSKSGRKIFSLFIAVAILLPTISKANSMTLNFSLQNSFKLYDKLIVSKEVNGETIYETINYGDTLLEPEKPSKLGYIFKGWYLDDGTEYDFDTPITGDISINPQFNIITYNITYSLNGGVANNPSKYTVEDEIFLNNPSKTGYTFIGWTGTDLSEKTENVTIAKGSTETRQYIANYIPTQYSITYKLDGGIATNPSTYTIEDDIILNNPIKEGYTFKGWGGTYLNGEENISVIIARGSTENRIYTANYSANTYTLIFNANTGTGNMANQTIEYDKEENITANTFTKSGYTFIGWNTEPDGSGTYYTDEQEVKNLTSTHEQIIELYAMWRELKVEDYVEYNPSSGDGAGLMYELLNAPEGTNISATFNSSDITKWRVFSISDGEVTLVAEKPTIQTVKLSGAYGYINGEKILNDIGNIYGHGIGAKEGRSIKLEDIEPYFRYDKTQFSSPGSNTGFYGGEKSYTSGNHIVDGRIVTATASSPQTLNHVTYWFNINNTVIYSQQENETANKIYKMLCEDISITNYQNNNLKYTPYWLADEGRYISSTNCIYSIHYIGDMHSLGVAEKGVRGLYNSSGIEYNAECSVLPIVKLKQSVKYKYDLDSNSWNITY